VRNTTGQRSRGLGCRRGGGGSSGGGEEGVSWCRPPPALHAAHELKTQAAGPPPKGHRPVGTEPHMEGRRFWQL
jgi:hypothetical protein